MEGKKDTLENGAERKVTSEGEKKEGDLFIAPHGNTPPPSLRSAGSDWQPPTTYPHTGD